MAHTLLQVSYSSSPNSPRGPLSCQVLRVFPMDAGFQILRVHASGSHKYQSLAEM